MKSAATAPARLGAIISLCLFIAAMIVPAPPLPEQRHAAPGVASLVVGYFFTGIIYWPAHALFLIGVVLCLAGRVKAAVVFSVFAAIAGGFTGLFTILQQWQNSTLLKYPAFPLWVLSMFTLLGALSSNNKAHDPHGFTDRP